MTFAAPLWLASRSPRRKLMLEQAGFDVRVRPADFDDAMLKPGCCSPYEWVTALAMLKAWRVADLVRGSGDQLALWCEPWSSYGIAGSVLGADTMCVKDGATLGQPRDAADARRMLHALRNAEHETITGVCLISLANGRRFAFCDRATVRVGALTDSQIEDYIASEGWRGKAGAYNLSERIDAGWPIECVGDPATVMGLPMKAISDLRFQIYD
jgi:septum formation protein